MKEIPDTIRWGIIGCGDVAERKCAPALYQTPGSELTAVMRRNGEKAADFARRHGVPRWYDDVDALLADDAINAIYVASPHYLHLEHVERAAATGRIILCEKPMGISVAEARQIVAVCHRAGVPLAVAYYRRLWPVILRLRALLTEGAVGEVTYVHIQLSDRYLGDPDRPWLGSRAMAGGGALANAGSHWVDLARFLFGELTLVDAVCSSAALGYDVDDTAALLLRAGNGAVIQLGATWTGVSVNAIDISGTAGRILVSPVTEGQITLMHADGRQERIDCRRVTSDGSLAHNEFIADLVASLREGRPLSVPGEVAVAAWELMEQAYTISAARDVQRG